MRRINSRAGRRSGLSLLDGLTVAGLITIGFLGLASGLVSSAQAHARSREDVPAIHALRQIAETVRGAPFREIAATFQGYTFQLPEIGATGRVTILVDETAISPDATKLGLPRDLDGDGVAATVDSKRYFLLPIKIEISWMDREGAETRSLYTLLGREKG